MAFPFSVILILAIVIPLVVPVFDRHLPSVIILIPHISYPVVVKLLISIMCSENNFIPGIQVVIGIHRGQGI